MWAGVIIPDSVLTVASILDVRAVKTNFECSDHREPV